MVFFGGRDSVIHKNQLPLNMQKQFNSATYDMQLLDKNLDELSCYCKLHQISLETLRNDHENRDESDDWKLEKCVHETESHDLMLEYYSTSKMYLYDLTLGESRHHYKNIFWSIKQFAQKNRVTNVLDFGAGIGGLVITLNFAGIKCDYADIPGQTWDYAKYKFKNRNLQVNQYSQEELKTKLSSYDMIVSLECLEHLSPLPEYISFFADLLKPAGLFIVTTSFYGIGLHIASNHKYNELRLFNELMCKNNLFFKGQLITRCGWNFLIPPLVLRFLGISTTSGRKLVYRKSK